MQALEQQARTGQKVALPASRKKGVIETELGGDLRLSNEFVDTLMGGSGGGNSSSNSNAGVITEAAIAKAAEELAGKENMLTEVDTATMHPANLVGKYHAWKIKNNYPIPGKAMVDDYRRRYLAMYASGQEAALAPARTGYETKAEIKIAVLDKFEQIRLPNTLEQLVGQIESTLEAKEAAVRFRESQVTAVFEGSSADELRVFTLMTAKKIGEVEAMFLRGDVNVNVVEPGSSATGLMRACSLGLLTIVKLFLKGGADPNFQSTTGITSLHCCWDAWSKVDESNPAKRMRFLITRDIITLLLEHGADSNLVSAKGVTPLHMAAQFGHDDIIALLLRHDADRTLRNKAGQTACDIADAAGHRAASSLLANWGHVQVAQRQEEFRLEWDGVLAANARSRRDRLTGKGQRGIKGKGAGSIAAVDDPRKASRVAVAKERESLFTTGEGMSAKELISNLELQERLRLRRKDIQIEARRAFEQTTGHVLLPVAEYDMERDVLREVDVVRDAEGIGDSNTALRARISGAGGGGGGGAIEKGKLPWGQLPERKPGKPGEEVNTDGLNATLPDEQEDIDDIEFEAEERKREEEEDGRLFGGQNRFEDDEEGNDDDDDEAEIRDGEGGGGGQDEDKAFAASSRSLLSGGGASNRTGGTSSRNLLLSTAKLPKSGSGSILEASKLKTPLSLAGDTSKLFGGDGKKRNDKSNNKKKGVIDGGTSMHTSEELFASSSRLHGNEEEEEEVQREGKGGTTSQQRPSSATAQPGGGGGNGNDDEDHFSVLQKGGPAANVDAENAALAAQKRRELRLRWLRETQRNVREREERWKESAARNSLLDLSEHTDMKSIINVHGTSSNAEQNSAGGGGEDGNAAGTTTATTTTTTTTTPDVGGVDDDLVEAAAKAQIEKDRIMTLYYGAPKIPKTLGKELSNRRVIVANMIATDINENMADFTRTYGDALITRKPTVSSYVLRPSRLRVDTRATIDADQVLREGSAFQALMSGDAGAVNAAGALVARKSNAIAPQERSGAASIAGMSGVALPTVAGNYDAGGGGGSVNMRPDGHIDAGFRNALAAKMGASKGNASHARVGFGTVGVNAPALLPATSAKRAAALASEFAIASNGVTLLRPESAAGSASNIEKERAAHASQQQQPLKEAGSRLRRMLMDAKNSQEAEFTQVQMLQDAEARATGTSPVKDRNKGGQQRKKGINDGKADVGTYGIGLLSSWPLHKAGPVEIQPGHTLREHAVLDVLTAAKTEHDAAVDAATRVYKKYENARALRATKSRGKGGDEETRAFVGGLAGMMEAAHGEARKVMQNDKVTADASLKESTGKQTVAAKSKADNAIPSLTRHGADALEFMTRIPPVKPAFAAVEEEKDLRNSRVSRYESYTSVDDPWKGMVRAKKQADTFPM